MSGPIALAEHKDGRRSMENEDGSANFWVLGSRENILPVAECRTS